MSWLCHVTLSLCLFTCLWQPSSSFLTIFGKKYVTHEGTIYSIEAGSGFGHHKVLPQSPTEISPEFYFYQSHDTFESFKFIEYFKLNKSIENIKLHSVHNERELFVVVHGYGKDWPKPFQTVALLETLQNEMSASVLLVRWTRGSAEPNYPQAAANTRIVGDMLHRVIDGLVQSGKVSLERVTCIGTGLGAHVCGFAGRKLRDFKRIIALDPAGPFFQNVTSVARLSKSDAEIVAVMHTNGQADAKGQLTGEGLTESVGHLDIWINGGKNQDTQPGCKRETFNPSTKTYSPQCGHGLAIKYFLEVLRNEIRPSDLCQQTLFPCADVSESDSCFPCHAHDSCPELHLSTLTQNSPARGDYSMYTRAGEGKNNFKFCGTTYKITISSHDRVEVKGNLNLTFTYSDGTVENHEFVGSSKKAAIYAGSVTHQLYVGPWRAEISGIQLRYTSQSAGFIGKFGLGQSGAKSWTAREVKVTKWTHPYTVAHAEMITVESGKPHVIPLVQLEHEMEDDEFNMRK